MTNAFALTSNAKDEKVEQFYDGIERTMADSNPKRKLKITAEDYNAISKLKISKMKEHFQNAVAFGTGERTKEGSA